MTRDDWIEQVGQKYPNGVGSREANVPYAPVEPGVTTVDESVTGAADSQESLYQEALERKARHYGAQRAQGILATEQVIKVGTLGESEESAA